MKQPQAASLGLLVVRVLLGVFLLFEGINKISWFADASLLAERFVRWRESVPAVSRWYLDTVAIPGQGIFAWLVPLGELGCGLALILGFYTPLMAFLALFMVMNFHVASGAVFEYDFLTNGYGLPVVGGLLGLTVGGGRLPLSVRLGRKK